MIAWGIVPTDEVKLKQENTESLFSKFQTILKQMKSKGIDSDKVLENSLFTPACGLGNKSLETAQKSASITRELSELIQSRLI